MIQLNALFSPNWGVFEAEMDLFRVDSFTMFGG
jgi:hypothetical protein